MQRTTKKTLRFSTDTLERYRARYPNESPSRQLRSGAIQTASDANETEVKFSMAAPAAKITTSVVSPNTAKKIVPTTEKITSRCGSRDYTLHQNLQPLDRTEQVFYDCTSSNPNQILNANETSTTLATLEVPKAPPTITIIETDHLEQKTFSNQCLESKDLAHTKCDGKQKSGRYVNWTSSHTSLASYAWCAMSDLIYFCDKYEFKSLSARDIKTHQQIQAEVHALLAGQAPFGQRQRFPTDIRDPENLWVCIGYCAGVEYHLNRILSAFRRPLEQLSADKQRTARQDFHLAINELRLDISARISEIKLFDRLVFERNFRLEWQETG